MSAVRSVTLSEELRSRFDYVQRVAFVCGGLGLALVILFSFHSEHTRVQFFRSYLFAFVYWISIPLGCQAILMMHHLTGGWWGYPIRRLLEAGTRTLFAMAVLFIPLLLGISRLYAWDQPAEIAADPIIRYKRPYLNPGFFTVRAVIYFAIWIGLAFVLNKWSREQDETGDPSMEGRFEAISGPGLILWGLALTFASVDWVMSLEVHWFSTIYGMIFMTICALAAMSFVILVERRLSDHEPLRGSVTPALGVPLLFAVSDHLVGQSKRRDSLVYKARFRRLGSGGCGSDGAAFRAAVLAAVATQREAEAHAAVAGCGDAHCPQPPGCLLDHRAGF